MLVNWKGTAEQTFIFLDTPDPRSNKKTHGQAFVWKEDPVAKRIVITDNAWKMCQTCSTQNLLAGGLVDTQVFQSVHKDE